MKKLQHLIQWFKGLFGRKTKDKKNDDVETAVSKSIPLEEAYRLYKKQQKKRGF